MSLGFHRQATRSPAPAPVLVGALLLFAVAPAALGASKPPVSGSYVGKSSGMAVAQVTFSVSANHKAITSFTSSVGYNGKCGQGGGPDFGFKVRTIPIKAGGQFAATVEGTDNATKSAIRITGTISKSSAHGTIAAVKPWFTCKPPNEATNPYSETFTAAKG